MMIIDRIEDNIAIIEQDENITLVDVSLLPKGCAEGSAIDFIDDKYILLEDITDLQRAKTKELLNKIF